MIEEYLIGGFNETFDVTHIKDAQEQYDRALFDNSDYGYYTNLATSRAGKVVLYVGDSWDV